MNDKKIYFISGGGTGGHIYPASTVVEKLLQDEQTEQIYFIGNPDNLEYEIIKRYEKVIFLPVKITGMPRKLGISLIKWVFQLLCAYLKAISYIKKYKPNAVFTTGGYVSAPIILASMSKKIPYMIHDCDSVPGLVSKMAAPKAQIVSVAFENSKKLLKSKNIILNGNPIRGAFFTITKEDARQNLGIANGKLVIFAMGGSQGAQTINTAMINAIKVLVQNENNYIILQTGKNKLEQTILELDKTYPEYKNKDNILIKPYFDDMMYPLKACDIVIARAGSLSLSEIIQCNVPSILIPYPHAAQDHQRKNAKEMQERGISLYIEDSECRAEKLLEYINSLILNPTKRQEMSEATKNFSKENPTEKIVTQLKSIAK